MKSFRLHLMRYVSVVFYMPPLTGSVVKIAAGLLS